MGENGHTVFDRIRNGYKRSVLEVNGRGTLGIAIPKDIVDNYDINKSDSVAIVEQDGQLLLDFGNHE